MILSINLAEKVKIKNSQLSRVTKAEHLLQLQNFIRLNVKKLTQRRSFDDIFLKDTEVIRILILTKSSELIQIQAYLNGRIRIKFFEITEFCGF